jgi:hypothetical protein
MHAGAGVAGPDGVVVVHARDGGCRRRRRLLPPPLGLLLPFAAGVFVRRRAAQDVVVRDDGGGAEAEAQALCELGVDGGADVRVHVELMYRRCVQQLGRVKRA